MGLFKKKEKKPAEPEFYLSQTNAKTINYAVYYMKFYEKILYFSLAFLVGAFVGFLFYGGIGKDNFGQSTTLTRILDILIPIITGIFAGFLFIPVRVSQIVAKRKKDLSLQFRELLDALATSIGAGKNIVDSFLSAKDDLLIQYPDDAYIINELEIIINGINNNINIENMLMDFGFRSGIDDVDSFANVFDTCYRKGANIKDVIRNTHQIISDKMEVQLEIQTIVAANAMEQKIMIAMPIALIAIIKGMSPEFAANFTSGAGIVSTTIAIGMFILAYFVGKKILTIKL